jgi:hypothetical protein
VLLLGIFSQACEKETPSTEGTLSSEAQNYFQLLTAAESEAGVSFGLTAADLQVALDNQQEGHAKVEICCYTASDLAAFYGCYGATAGYCLGDWDFNEDGIINTADLLVVLANYGCPEVTPVVQAPSSMFVDDQISGVIKNKTLLDGDYWYINYTSDIFDEVRWYFDGVLVSSNLTVLQLQYPGATDYDVAIDCNGSYHLIELYIMVDCEVYSTSACVEIALDEVLPPCKSDYCTP